MKLEFALAFALLCCLGAQAQMPGATGPTGMDMAMLKLFGDIKDCTAKLQVRILDETQQEVISMPMDFAMRDSNVRMDIDLTQAKGNSMPPGAADSLKQMGMAQLCSITRRDKNLSYVVYPGPKMLLSMPLPKEASTNDAIAKMDKTEQGKEDLDGHPCVKTKVVFRDDSGKNIEALTWYASDLKNFPLQIQAKEKDNTSILHFTEVKLTKPDAKQFEPPAGYTQYTNQMELMQGMMTKMTQDPAPPKK
jgi:hypothetical protein